jgi:hypothetical protein
MVFATLETMNRRFGLSALAALAVVYACSASPIREDQDRRADRSHYQTYQWISTSDVKTLRLDDPNIDYVTGYSHIARRPDIELQLQIPVDRQLQAKGYRLAEHNPDFYVTFYGRSKSGDWVSTWDGRAPSVNDVPVVIFPDYDRSEARRYRDGTLLLVLYDAKTTRPAWTGVMNNAYSATEPVSIAELEIGLGKLASSLPRKES